MLSNVAPLAAGTNRPSMKICVRGESAAARWRQSAAVRESAAMGSERRRGGGGDDLTDLAADIAKTMWRGAREIVGITRLEHTRLAAHRELDAPADHDTALLATMREHFLTGSRSGLVSLVQHRELATRPLSRHQPQRGTIVANLEQLGGAIEHLWRARHVEREEFGHG